LALAGASGSYHTYLGPGTRLAPDVKGVLAGSGEACLRLRRDAEELEVCIPLRPLI